MEIIIINLERAKERRIEIVTQLHKQDIPYKVLNAFDADDFNNPSYDLITKRPMKAFANLNPNRRKMRLSDIGCILSHISAIKFAQTLRTDKVLIFEDDCVLSPDFKERLKLIQEVPNDADIIYLGGIMDKISNKRKISEHVWSLKRESIYGLHSYIVTEKGYKSVIKNMMSMDDTCDSLVLDGIENGSIIGYTILPWCTYQAEGISYIANRKQTERIWRMSKTYFSEKL